MSIEIFEPLFIVGHEHLVRCKHFYQVNMGVLFINYILHTHTHLWPVSFTYSLLSNYLCRRNIATVLRSTQKKSIKYFFFSRSSRSNTERTKCVQINEWEKLQTLREVKIIAKSVRVFLLKYI